MNVLVVGSEVAASGECPGASVALVRTLACAGGREGRVLAGVGELGLVVVEIVAKKYLMF